jgi:hypothetical protein
VPVTGWVVASACSSSGPARISHEIESGASTRWQRALGQRLDLRLGEGSAGHVWTRDPRPMRSLTAASRGYLRRYRPIQVQPDRDRGAARERSPSPAAGAMWSAFAELVHRGVAARDLSGSGAFEVDRSVKPRRWSCSGSATKRPSRTWARATPIWTRRWVVFDPPTPVFGAGRIVMAVARDEWCCDFERTIHGKLRPHRSATSGTRLRARSASTVLDRVPTSGGWAGEVGRASGPSEFRRTRCAALGLRGDPEEHRQLRDSIAACRRHARCTTARSCRPSNSISSRP